MNLPEHIINVGSMDDVRRALREIVGRATDADDVMRISRASGEGGGGTGGGGQEPPPDEPPVRPEDIIGVQRRPERPRPPQVRAQRRIRRAE